MNVRLDIVMVAMVAVAMTTVHALSETDVANQRRDVIRGDTYRGIRYVTVSNGDITRKGKRCLDDPAIAVWSILLRKKKFTCSGSLNVAQWMDTRRFWEDYRFSDYISYLKYESGIQCSYTKSQNGPDFKYPLGPDLHVICTYDPVPGTKQCHKRCRYVRPELKTEPPPCRLSRTPYDSKCESSGEFAMGAMILNNVTYGCNYEWNVGTWEQGMDWTEKRINYAFSLPMWDVRCCYPTNVRIPWRRSDGGQEEWIQFDRACNVKCNYEAPC